VLGTQVRDVIARRGTPMCAGKQDRVSRARGDSHHSNGIVIEDGWDVFGGELVGGVANEQTGLAHGTITDDHTPAHRNVVSNLLVLDVWKTLSPPGNASWVTSARPRGDPGGVERERGGLT
jgi:hypothetical protein